jgi:peptidoglycan/LPS O-acetylase OafA/YrhL
VTSTVEAATRPGADLPTKSGPIPNSPGVAGGVPGRESSRVAKAAGTGTRKRLDHIDAMRPIKQSGVVSTHTLLFFAPAASLAAGASLMLLHVTREAFLFVSACMLTYSYRGLGKGGLSTFYWRRFMSVGLPYLAWTVIYFAITLPSHANGISGSLGHLAYLTGTGYYQLYYLLVIMQFYLVFPILAVALERTKGHHGVVLLACGLAQVAIVSMMHWSVFPAGMRGFWASREIISYEFYLIAGMVVALHLDDVHRWISSHVRLIIAFTVVSAAVAEVWYYLAAEDHVAWLGSSSDPFQPVVIPFNIGAIACIYLAGMALVDRRRSRRVRAMVRSGSDDSYGIYLAQMVFVTALVSLGWKRLDHIVPWPVLVVVTVALVFLASMALTSVLARTPLAKALTGRSKASWSSWLPARDPAADVDSPKPSSSPMQPDAV